VGHGGMSKTYDAIKDKYSWVPEDLVKKFCACCTRCTTRRSLAQPVAAKPILAKGFMCRLQVDLIDMHNRPDGSSKYICHARDHFSKFCWSSALPSKEAKEQKLSKWMEDKGTNNWASGLCWVTYAMNMEVSSVTGFPPYQIVFGRKPPENIERNAENQCQEKSADRQWQRQNFIEQQAEEISNLESTSTHLNNSRHTSVTISSDEYDSDECNALHDITNLPTDHYEVYQVARDRYTKNAKIMREKMLRKNAKRKISYEIGDFVRIGIPKIDRSSTDRKLLICKVVGTVDGEFYRLGCKSGVLNVYYRAVELMPTKAMDFPELREIPNTLISLREASLYQSRGEMTGYQCNCKGSCRTNHCNCKKAGVMCGARCHGGGSNTCENQNE
ncbi:13546_t:CDS:2, partial [Ambispora gerdemannii]